MLFNSLIFLVFFAAFFTLYWFGFARQKTARNLFLLCGSYVFYAWWDWRFLGLIVLSSAVDFAIGQAIHASDVPGRRKALLSTSLFLNLGLLGIFKYYNFFIDSLDALIMPFGLSVASAHLEIVLPVGISFYTFQTLSYSLDIYRRRLEPTKDPIQFFAFVTFFPQLVAGPIERAKDLLPQFNRDVFAFNAAYARSGLLLAMWGMFKKVVVADRLALVVDAAFEAPDGIGGASAAWALVCFTGQLYLDFSAYSDIAIGISRMLGFQLSENFKRPYFASNFSDFWKRWHITLSSWFRDYLYIPLGGSRVHARRAAMNVMIVFLVSGLWHGASWNFVVWGALNGFFLIVLDPLLNRSLGKCGLPGRWASALLVTGCWALSLTFFRASTFEDSWTLANQIFTWAPATTDIEFSSTGAHRLTWMSLLAVLTVESIAEKWNHAAGWMLTWRRPMRWSVYLMLVFGTILLGAHGLEIEDQQFIYFQF